MPVVTSGVSGEPLGVIITVSGFQNSLSTVRTTRTMGSKFRKGGIRMRVFPVTSNKRNCLSMIRYDVPTTREVRVSDIGRLKCGVGIPMLL